VALEATCVTDKKTGSEYPVTFRQPGCLGKTRGFPPHPREWFGRVVYHVPLSMPLKRHAPVIFLGGLPVGRFDLLCIVPATKKAGAKYLGDISATRLSQ
jgi:hypothetical protein